MCVAQLHMSCSGVQDSHPGPRLQSIPTKKYGHAESRLIHIAAPITLDLRKPKLLGYNGTTRPDIIIKNPGTSSIYRKRGRTKV